MLDPRKKARLFWQCRRGMLELDLILQDFLQERVDGLAENEKQAFESLLNSTDVELYAWLMGHETPENKELYHIVSLIRNHH